MRNWSLKYFFSLWCKLRQKNFFNSCFVKVPILSFPIHLAAIKWFLFLFFPSWKLYFFFAGFFFRMCYCSVFGYFQIAFNNLTSNKQTNENWWKKQFVCYGRVKSVSFKLWYKKTADIALFPSKYTKTQWRRGEDCTQSVTRLSGPCFVSKVAEYRKLSVATCTYKNL